MIAPSTLPPRPTCEITLRNSPMPATTVASLSTRKNTEVVHQPASGKPCVEPNITNNDQRLNAVSRSMYLGRALCKKVVFNDEVNARLAKGSVAFGMLYKFVWNRRGIIT